ncbi:hypothetical protein [uncultured Desulfuromusa sp.]|uniref:hypothetical protein n=1 Tax=uncultured Desulfuromusa sp. TaxID=219183 RepID=UPI002AA7291E|nr:hypothetical protein [uncultured Desulfuromusa sp.]
MPAIFLLILTSLLLSGCVATPSINQSNPVFFPQAPAPPRIQFLTGIGNSNDVAGDTAEVVLFSMNAVQQEELKGFSKPYGITARGSQLYVCDTVDGTVAAIDLRQQTFTWLKGNFGPGALKKPINLEMDNDGKLYVADTGRKQVVTYDHEGNFLRVYGSGYDMKPVDVAIDARRVYVLDMSRHKILVFNKQSGELIEGLGQDADNPLERLYLASNMTLTEQGLFYVANAGTGSIIKLDRDGHVLGTFGKMGDGFGQFGRPRGVATDSKKRFYVVDAAHQNVQLFNDQDRLLMFFGDPGLPVGSLNIPAGISVTDQDLDFYEQYAAPGFILEQVVVVISQVGRYKINIYGLGKMQGIDYEAYYRDAMKKVRKIDGNQPRKKQ